MDIGMTQVLESVFGKSELDAVSVEEIRELLAEFPAFNAGHYLLSLKLKGGDVSDYNAANRQTALYFNNPLWLQHLLEESPGALTSGAEASETSPYNSFSPETENLPAAAESATGHDIAPSEHLTLNEWFHSAEADAPTINESIHRAQEDEPAVNDVIQMALETLPTVNESLETASDKEPVLNEVLTAPTALTEKAIESLEDIPKIETIDGVTTDNRIEGPDEYSEPEMGPVSASISAGLAAAAAELLPGKPALNAFDEKKAKAIVFEPYHTIDYFASQGIKLVLDDIPGDSFGRQLKSFTEWLKTMKRLPVQPLTGKADETQTAEVKHFAAHSVEDRDILTETMAEVLVKQGMNDNAIGIYEKLSLIYPLKSAYFAARIQQLKSSGS